jgi:DNA-binding beta-propeller fold protein YncE
MMQTRFWRLSRALTATAALAATGGLHAQVSPSAYRVLGQPDFRQNGLNMVNGTELYSPNGIALDTRGSQARLYISDTQNSRVLGWPDAVSYQGGDPPAIVLGQASLRQTASMGIGAKGFNLPLGLAVDPRTGNLYVADYGNNRVLRFPDPFATPSRVEPDAVYGQPDFTARTAGVARGYMNRPRAVAVDGNGNLWVADTGNNRVLRFAAISLDNMAPPDADTVIGQKDFISGAPNRGGQLSASGFDQPASLAFDGQNNLYVSDANNARILKFPAPLGPASGDVAADGVLGQPDFRSRDVPPQATASTMAGPLGLSVDASGKIYVAVARDSRVLVFSPGSTAAGFVLGQPDFSYNAANVGVFPMASPNTLSPVPT